MWIIGTVYFYVKVPLSKEEGGLAIYRDLTLPHGLAVPGLRCFHFTIH